MDSVKVISNVLICPDKFKGSLAAKEVAEAIEEGILRQNPGVVIKKIPLADGGEGSSAIMAEVIGAKIRKVQAKDPLRREISAPFYYSSSSKTAIIEMASVSGYELLTAEERNPFLTSTHGTGDLIQAATDEGAEKIILFVGGSATNDGGAGMLETLGFTFQTESGSYKPGGEGLREIRSIILPELNLPEILVAHDVSNPLLGKSGATYVYSPQKGARKEDIPVLEESMQHFCKLIESVSGKSLSEIPGMGASGGIALGLVGFFDAQMVRGFDLIAETVSLEEHILWADLVISGEGRLDNQSKEGKVVGEMEKLCEKLDKPLTLFCGHIDGYESLGEVICLVDHVNSAEESINMAYPLLVKLSSGLFR